MLMADKYDICRHRCFYLVGIKIDYFVTVNPEAVMAQPMYFFNDIVHHTVLLLFQ
jgi:hypothetical protein